MEIWIVFFALLLMTSGTKSQYQTIYLSDEETTTITSPNYPSNYDNNADIWWTVIAPTGFRIMIHFNDFNLEESWWNGDALWIYLGLTYSLSDATHRATLTGNSLPGDISSTGSYMWLHFTSDWFGSRKGFSLSVNTIEPDKHEVINLTSEESMMNTTSPNYPDDYDNNVGVLWQFIVPIGFRIRVQFSVFELDDGSDSREGDSLIVYQGLTNSLDNATLRALLSGYSLPLEISSIGSYLWILFTSDYTVTRKGFSLSVSVVKPEVIYLTSEETMVNINSPNYPGYYPNNVGMWWKVIAPTGIRISLQFNDFKISTGDYLTVYLGLTDSLSDATWRATLSGFSLPDDISSTGSYMWLYFTSDDLWGTEGFSLSVSAMEPDKHEVINLTNDESMMNITSPNYPDDYDNNVGVLWQVIAPIGSRIRVQFSVFDLDDGSDSREGDSLIVYHGLTNSLDNATLRDLLSGSSLPLEISSLGSYLWIWFTSDYTVTRRGFSLSVGTYKPETTSLSTDAYTSPSVSVPSWSTTQPTSPQISNSIRSSSTMSTKESTEKAVTKSEASTNSPVPSLQENLRGQNTAAIAAACSVVVLVVLAVVIIIVCIRKRSRNPKMAAPHEKDEDDSNLFNNPVYCSKDGGLPIPDLIIGTTFNDGRSPRAPLKPADVDSQYEEFEGHRHPKTNIGDSQPHIDAFSGIVSESGELNPVTYYTIEDPSAIAVNDDALNEDDYHTYEQAINPRPSKKPKEATMDQTGTGSLYQDLDKTSPPTNDYSSLDTKKDLPQHGTQNGGKDGQTDGSAILDDELEYNALTFNKSSDITRALKTPAGVSDIKANNGYGVLDLPKEGHSEQSTQLHNNDVYNTIGGSPHEQDNTKQPPPESFSGYQALNHGPPDPQISRQGLNPQRVPPVSPGEYQSLSTGPKGSGPKMEASGSDQPDDESEYHSYQDPRQMDMNGSVPREPNAFSSDQYNILNSGKEVGDYHVYQNTTEDGMDEGTYEDFNSKTSHDDEYSTVDHMKIQDPKAVDAATFEPIYSEEVYSEFQ